MKDTIHNRDKIIDEVNARYRENILETLLAMPDHRARAQAAHSLAHNLGQEESFLTENPLLSQTLASLGGGAVGAGLGVAGGVPGAAGGAAVGALLAGVLTSIARRNKSKKQIAAAGKLLDSEEEVKRLGGHSIPHSKTRLLAENLLGGPSGPGYKADAFVSNRLAGKETGPYEANRGQGTLEVLGSIPYAGVPFNLASRINSYLKSSKALDSTR